MTRSQPKPLFPRGACDTGTSPECAAYPSSCPNEQRDGREAQGVTLTIQELGALRVAFLHLLALVGGRLHVTVGHGKDSCSRLHQELAHLHVIAGCCTVQRGPARQGHKDGTSLPQLMEHSEPWERASMPAGAQAVSPALLRPSQDSTSPSMP